jgi:hypothetical protein
VRHSPASLAFGSDGEVIGQSHPRFFGCCTGEGWRRGRLGNSARDLSRGQLRPCCDAGVAQRMPGRLQRPANAGSPSRGGVCCNSVLYGRRWQHTGGKKTTVPRCRSSAALWRRSAVACNVWTSNGHRTSLWTWLRSARIARRFLYRSHVQVFFRCACSAAPVDIPISWLSVRFWKKKSRLHPATAIPYRDTRDRRRPPNRLVMQARFLR